MYSGGNKNTNHEIKRCKFYHAIVSQIKTPIPDMITYMLPFEYVRATPFYLNLLSRTAYGLWCK
jgi:hypothetical protein